MKFTLPWLKEHLETGASAEEIAERLTNLGLEVEAVEDPAAALGAFTVARVREVEPHPRADRLSLCTVETRQGVFRVVCGAPNVRPGMLAIFGAEGVRIPGTGQVLKRAVIRGVESCGMLMSERELGLGDDHSGIVEVAGDVAVGTPAAQALGLEGPVIEVAVTPNRGDCFGVLGIARELAACGLGRLRPRDFTPVPSRGLPGPDIRLEFPPGQEDACPVFLGRIIRGVRNRPSPAWLQRRLRAIGLRPISALVDITNYVMFDLCRPLHVYDAGKLQGDLVLRFARPGERLRALDGVDYELDDGMVVIADDSGPVALGGIMGGESTGVDENTEEVLLEVALFDPLRVAATGRRLGIESDARTRFERGLDPLMLLPGAELATRLIVEICGGEAGPAVIAGRIPERRRELRFRTSQLARLAGITLEREEMERILRALGFELEGGPEVYLLTVPSWRHDVSSEACIVEELTRVHGYGHIPPTPVTRTEAVGAPAVDVAVRMRHIARRTAADLGLFEIVSWSFIPEAHARMFGAEEPIRLQNPLSSELDTLRPSLLPGLLAAAARNLARKQERGALFEIGPRFLGPEPGAQATSVAGLRFGDAVARHWAERPRPVDAIDAKSDLWALLGELGVRREALRVDREVPSWFHPGRAGRVLLGPNRLALFGELHPEVLRHFDLSVPVVGFEFDLEALPRPRVRAAKARPPLEPLPYPPADRDFAFVVDRDVPAEELLRLVRNADRRLVREVRLFDVYEGPGIPEGKKSLAVAVRLQASDHTLSEDEIERVAHHIIETVQNRLGAELRR